jgi:predicted DNA-binding protein (MmcQ/YjbR family)
MNKKHYRVIKDYDLTTEEIENYLNDGWELKFMFTLKNDYGYGNEYEYLFIKYE